MWKWLLIATMHYNTVLLLLPHSNQTFINLKRLKIVHISPSSLSPVSSWLLPWGYQKLSSQSSSSGLTWSQTAFLPQLSASTPLTLTLWKNHHVTLEIHLFLVGCSSGIWLLGYTWDVQLWGLLRGGLWHILVDLMSHSTNWYVCYTVVHLSYFSKL